MTDKRTTTGLADDARKIAEALRFYADPFSSGADRVPDFYNEMCFGECAEDALPLVESLPGKIEAWERKHALDRIDWWHEATNTTTRAEAAESQLSTVTRERDEARAEAKNHHKVLLKMVVCPECNAIGDKPHTTGCESVKVLPNLSLVIGTIEALESQLSERDAEIARLRKTLFLAEEGLVAARKHELETCEEYGYSESELPSDALDYIDVPLAVIRTALSPPIAAKQDEPTEHDDDLTAAHCVKYYQQRELD